MDKTRLQYSDPELGTGSSSWVWNPSLLKVDRNKQLPKLRQNPVFWTKRKCIIITTTILVILVAGIIIGIVAGVVEKHHVSPPDSSSSSGNPSSSPLTLTSSSLSVPAPTPSPQPIPATLLTSFQSDSSWIWLGPGELKPGGDWAFRKTLPTSTAPAKEAIALLTVDNGFELYHNGQFITANMAGWQTATAVHVNLDPDSNVFAILALNFPPLTALTASTPAGLVASIQVSYADGTTASVSSDATWLVAQPVPDGFQSLSFNNTQWQSATEIAKYGSGSWGSQVMVPQSYNITTR